MLIKLFMESEFGRNKENVNGQNITIFRLLMGVNGVSACGLRAFS